MGRRQAPGRDQASRHSWVVWGAVGITLAVRLPLLDLPAWPDEAGFLTVGGGWHLGDARGDQSLYDAYWVDRPPVLITWYGLAERLGGLLALRLMGAMAAALTVVGVAWIGHSVAGARAGRWAAVTMAAFLCTPFHWSFMVDGELVAAPLVAAGMGCLIRGCTVGGPRGLLLSGMGGVTAGAAILTKQNFADVFVFEAALMAACVRSRSVGAHLAARHLGAFLGGVAGCVAAVAVWTTAHGTSLPAVFYAMYPFRLDAAATGPGGAGAISWDRLAAMGTATLLSGLAVLTVWVGVSCVRWRIRDPRVLALLAVLVFDLFSIAGGAHYWLHYLIQLAVPVAALAGILAARSSTVRWWSVCAVVTAFVGWVVLVMSPPQTAEELVGQAIGRSATSHDTIVVVPGRSNVGYAAGLRSPYPYLWALPARTLDPGKAALLKLLSGPRAPTWLVSWRAPRDRGPDLFREAVAGRYRQTARICGQRVYVRRDVARPRPVAHDRPAATKDSRCESVSVLPPLLRGLL